MRIRQQVDCFRIRLERSHFGILSGVLHGTYEPARRVISTAERMLLTKLAATLGARSSQSGSRIFDRIVYYALCG